MTTRVLGSLRYHTSPQDPVTLAGAALLLIIVGIAAGWIPAMRAAAVDPVRALRAD